MFWLACILTLFVLPFAIEVLRRSVRRRQKRAPGQLARLSRGRTHYQWFGPESGPVVVCVHGLTTPSFVWHRCIEHLTGLGARVLVYDLYGRGFSDRPFGLQDSHFFVTQLRELLDDQHITGRVTLMGYSMGGSIVPAFTAAYPDRVAHMMLIAPGGMGHDLGAICDIAQRKRVVGTWLMHAIYPLKYLWDLNADADAPDDIISGQLKELLYRGFLRSVRASLRGILSEDMAPIHQEIARHNIHSLTIWAKDDTVIPLAGQAKLQEWSPDMTQIIIPESGHGVTFTHANIVGARIVDWLAQQCMQGDAEDSAQDDTADDIQQETPDMAISHA